MTQIKLIKESFSAIAINHKWNGAAPNFISKTKAIIVWYCIKVVRERSKMIEAIAWNKKYLTGWVEGLNRLEAIRRSKNLKTLTSIHSQIVNKEDLAAEIVRLARFIKTLSKINKGEIKEKVDLSLWVFLTCELVPLFRTSNKIKVG